MSKECRKCKQTFIKPENHFRVNLKSKDGLYAYCRECSNEMNRFTKDKNKKPKEKRIINMKTGEAADSLVPAAEAYGEYDPKGVQTLPIEQFSGIEDLKIGMQIQAQDENDQPIQFIVKEIAEKEITVDFNHPLAGKDLQYKIKIDSLL